MVVKTIKKTDPFSIANLVKLSPIIIFFILQLVGAIWWASGQSSDTKAIKEIVISLQKKVDDGYTKREAEADFRIRDEKIANNAEKIRILYEQYRNDFSDLKNMLGRMEIKIDDFLFKKR